MLSARGLVLIAKGEQFNCEYNIYDNKAEYISHFEAIVQQLSGESLLDFLKRDSEEKNIDPVIFQNKKLYLCSDQLMKAKPGFKLFVSDDDMLYLFAEEDLECKSPLALPKTKSAHEIVFDCSNAHDFIIRPRFSRP
ncbi:MAG: hypothetical protein MK033_10920 [Candidatus Caenarcaniphilales bacterium]|nr:hypothetical protein [Candidatus Caenarcaniphilales bacterium]